MRAAIAIISVISTLLICAAGAQTVEITAEQLLSRGIDSFRSGRYENAVGDLNAATRAFLSQEQMQTYVNTGEFPGLDRLETALIYLATAQAKLGREDDARETILRVMSAERMKPTYARLALPAEVGEFENIAVRLVPGVSFRSTPPPIQVAQAVPATPTPIPTPAPAPPPPMPVAMVQPPDCADCQRQIQEAVAQERARNEAALEKRIEEIRAAAQKIADDRIAAERIAIQRAADERIATLQSQMRRGYLLSLQQADAFAANGQLEEANAIYNRLANAEDAPREVLAAVAVGLYRTGDFPNAANVLRKLGTFARGEADLRYYNAVALYETGQFAQARKELACALPFIQVTDDVSRYQSKIERTASQQAVR